MKESSLTKEQQIKKVLTYRWAVYAILILSYFIVFVHRMSVGIIKQDLVDAFAMTPVGFATLGAMYFYAYAAMQIPTGILADTLGARVTVTIGCIVTGIGSVLFGMAPIAPLAFFGRLLVGLGVSVTFISVSKIQTMWFKEKEFGTLSGLTQLLGNMGGVMAQTPMAIIVAALTWRTTFIGMGVVSLAIAVFCFLIIRNKPQDMGLPSIAEIEGRKEDIKKGEKVSVKEGLKGVLSNKRVIAPFVFLLCYSAVFLTFTGTWGVSYIKDVYGLDNISASKYITYMMIGQAFSALLIGFVSDKIRSRKLPLIALGLTGNLALLAIVIGGKLPIGLLGVLLVVFSASLTCLGMSWPIAKEVNNPKYAGMGMSVVNMGAFIGGAIGPAVFASLLNQSATGLAMYRPAMIFLSAVCIVGYIVSLFAKETKCRNIYYDGKSDKTA